MGAFYCASLVFNTAGWAKENLKFGPAGPDPTTLYLIQVCGVLCGGLQVCKHAARVNGKRAPVLGLPLDAWGAITWGSCCYLNWSNPSLLTEAGAINVYVCGFFSATAALAAGGVIKLKAD